MLFSSIPFLFWFLPIGLGGYLVIGRLQGARGLSRALLGWLLATSLFAYGWYAPTGIFLILASVGANFLVARAISRSSRTAGNMLLALAVSANLALLGWFKYAGFFLASARALAGQPFDVPATVLPLGVSFFTLQQVSYVVDVWRRRDGETDPLRYAVYITFFPHLIAGPLVLHHHLLPQLRNAWRSARMRSHDLACGSSIFALGLAKKCLFADRIAPLADAAFRAAADGTHLTTPQAWLGIVAYTLQIYFDFSAYSDMAIGLAMLFGLKLPVNFLSPYKSTSIIEFWRRWHITLSSFLRDYLYVSLGGNRKGPIRRYVNLMLTMLIGGLWHGAGWTFVAWGALHGAYLVVNHGVRRVYPAPATPSAARAAVQWCVTMGAVMVAWVFFRSPTFDAALQFLRAMAGMATHAGTLAAADAAAAGAEAQLSGIAGASGLQLVIVGAAAAVAVLMPNVAEMFAREHAVIDSEGAPTSRSLVRLQYRPGVVWAAATVALLWASVWSLDGAQPFIYFAF